MDDQLLIQRQAMNSDTGQCTGCTASLLDNMVKGVSEGFTIVQELVGVGYKAAATGQMLELALGYSHNIRDGTATRDSVATTD